MRHIFTLLVSLWLQSCAYSIHQNHMGSFDESTATKGKIIKVDHKEQIIFADFTDVNWVDRSYQELMAKCPAGRIIGISTLYATDLGFFSWKERIRLEGSCITP
ncbi:MAG: hypothetical protein OXT67_08875 [Zetaproteobacteria bacterium]|nr:hypothetical protein [Zetaproteobacteria bacterium]